MAPELHAKSCSYEPEKVDVWAIGVTLFYLVEGMYPFKGYDDKDLSRKVRQCEYAVRKGSPNFEEFVSHCLEFEPSNRPSCTSLLQSAWLLDA